jgi:hypothetical protein
MRNVKLWLGSALLAPLVFAGAGVSQPPKPKVVPDPPSRLGVDDIVERIMAFDKNKDGKVTKDELPERMQHLIALGDTNKDGALDRDEIKKLATPSVAAPGGFGPDGGFGIGVAGPGPGGPGGFRAAGAIGPGPGGPGGPGLQLRIGPGPGGVEGIVDDLKLAGKKKDEAKAAVKAHQENVRKLMDQARADLIQKMKEILSEEEFKDFKAALDRPGGGETFFGAAGLPTPDVLLPKR